MLAKQANRCKLVPLKLIKCLVWRPDLWSPLTQLTQSLFIIFSFSFFSFVILFFCSRLLRAHSFTESYLFFLWLFLTVLFLFCSVSFLGTPTHLYNCVRPLVGRTVTQTCDDPQGALIGPRPHVVLLSAFPFMPAHGFCARLWPYFIYQSLFDCLPCYMCLAWSM